MYAVMEHTGDVAGPPGRRIFWSGKPRFDNSERRERDEKAWSAAAADLVSGNRVRRGPGRRAGGDRKPALV